MTTILTSTTSTTGYVLTPDTTGTLVVKTGAGAGTTALTLDASQNATFAGTVSSSSGTLIANSMVLLGTLTTTSGTTQTLSGLTLTGYSMLIVDVFEVSNSGTAGNFTMAGQSLCSVSGTATNAISGIVQVMLQTGTTVSSVANNKAIGAIGLTTGGNTTSSGSLAITTATTSIAFAMSAGAFDNGTIRVYGVE